MVFLRANRFRNILRRGAKTGVRSIVKRKSIHSIDRRSNAVLFIFFRRRNLSMKLRRIINDAIVIRATNVQNLTMNYVCVPCELMN